MVQGKQGFIHILRPQESPIGASVRAYVQTGAPGDFLAIEDTGKIMGVPGDALAFSLRILAPQGVILCQRDHGSNEYRGLRGPEPAMSPDVEWWEATPIEIGTSGSGLLYTRWQDRERPHVLNNAGLWEVERNHVTFWEIGILSPNGRDFYAAHDIRWDGNLYGKEAGDIVGVPSNFMFGPFSVRDSILDYGPFIVALPILPMYKGSDEELEVPLAPPESPNVAIIDFWHMFMGMGRGQGICLLHESFKRRPEDKPVAWLRGQEVEGLDPDKLVRLVRGQRLELIPQRNGKVVLNDMGHTPRIVGARLL